MTDILNMRGLDIDPTRSAETDESITIGIKRRPEPDTVCHHCYANRLAPNGARVVSYADLPVRQQPYMTKGDMGMGTFVTPKHFGVDIPTIARLWESDHF